MTIPAAPTNAPSRHALFARPMARIVAALALTTLLGACRVIPEGHPPVAAQPVPARSAPQPAVQQSAASAMPSPPPPVPAPNALALGLVAGPDIATLGLTPAAAGPALVSFRESCTRLAIRRDISGLTQPADWQSACAAAATWPASDAAGFFANWFETAQIGSGATYVTGYYEPEIAGSRARGGVYNVPVFAMPADLVRARAGDALPKPNGDMPFGRYDENGHFGPYYSRAEIDGGALEGKNAEIAWVADPVEFYFLQIQGSGRLRAADGSVMRIGYAADNGHDYTGIAAPLREKGLIGNGPGQYPGSMQGIMQYLREHPEEGRALMLTNKSWVFFREVTGDGPIGAMGVPVRPRVSLAADPLFVPLGAPVFLRLDPWFAGSTVANGLWVAQDTGGAIKGPNRFDTFWGTGPDARTIAGGLIGRGNALVLLPRGTVARAIAAASAANPGANPGTAPPPPYTARPLPPVQAQPVNAPPPPQTVIVQPVTRPQVVASQPVTATPAQPAFPPPAPGPVGYGPPPGDAPR